MSCAAMAGSATAAPAANFEVGALGTTIIESSGFGAQSYRLRNDGTEPITRLRIDLAAGPTMFPDIVFDPAGQAGNEVGKPFTVDLAPALVTAEATYLPAGPLADGYPVLDVAITPGLGAGEELKFSIDTDPTVLRDSIAGPNGKISGAEIHGATVEVTFATAEGDLVLANDLSKSLGSDIESSVKLPASVASAPAIAAAATATGPATVSDPVQTVSVSGPAGTPGIILVAEGHLFLAGTEGFDVDPFEANVLVGYTEYAFTIGAGGTVDVPVLLSKRALSAVADAPPGLESEQTGLNYVTAWLLGGNGTTSPVSAPLVMQWDGTTPVVEPPNPPTPLPVTPPPPPPTTLVTVPDGILGLANCQTPAPTPAPSTGGGTIRLSAGQLRTNQRIGQAAIRRLNAIQQWLDDGIVGRDLCGGTLGPREAGAGLSQIPGAAPLVSRADPRPLRISAARGSGTVALSSAQLRINQRIYRAALLRARALSERISGKLTGGDIEDGSIGSDRFALPLVASGASTAAAAPSRTPKVTLTEKGGTITLSAGQLRTNQKIAQRAVREANALRAKLERGLLGSNFLADSIGPADLSQGD